MAVFSSAPLTLSLALFGMAYLNDAALRMLRR
ncbi:hypothetical protein EKPJFOCH_4152 [Methylobacterium thuringiense]|uniref:Uncharacterized protein n=1 Tax=Methylobacterium thuringiense TaxID=1003091 RepID=A0ABQ4TT92_9HYPH|nr:hypothetical protein EKPJFOCH_4152 [Methylobacterium thuringiense]